MAQENSGRTATLPLMEALANLCRANPMVVTHQLMGKTEDWMEMADNAANHLAVTLAYNITHPNGVPGTNAAAAAALTAALTVRDVISWMMNNPQQAATIENKLKQYLQDHALTEADFDRRAAGENFEAVNEASYAIPQMLEGLEGPPPETIDGLEIIIRNASEEEHRIRGTAEGGPDPYLNDTHYDQFQTMSWAWTMAQAARNRQHQPGTADADL